MADVVFPPDPSPGDTFTSGDTTWQWDGAKWVLQPPSMAMTAGHGEILIGGEDGNVMCLPAGADNQRLVADDSQAGGARWVDVQGSDVLALLAPIDGAGSGLDADKVDGVQALDLAPTAHPTDAGGTAYGSLPGVLYPSYSTFAPAPNVDYIAPIFILGAPVRVIDIRAEVTSITTTGNIRMGIARLDRNYQGVGAPLLDSGAVVANTLGWKAYAPPSTLVLQPGIYGLLYNCDAAVTVRTIAGTPLGGVPLQLGGGISNLGPTWLSTARAFGPFPSDIKWTTFNTPTSANPRYHCLLVLGAP